MIAFIEKLNSEVLRSIERIESRDTDVLKKSLEASRVLGEAFDRLKQYIIGYRFQNDDEEIGKIRFDEIADIEVGSVFVGILLRNGYLFYLSRTEPLKTCIYTHGGWGSISEISPRGIAGHIGRELHGKLGDHTAVD